MFASHQCHSLFLDQDSDGVIFSVFFCLLMPSILDQMNDKMVKETHRSSRRTIGGTLAEPIEIGHAPDTISIQDRDGYTISCLSRYPVMSVYMRCLNQFENDGVDDDSDDDIPCA